MPPIAMRLVLYLCMGSTSSKVRRGLFTLTAAALKTSTAKIWLVVGAGLVLFVSVLLMLGMFLVAFQTVLSAQAAASSIGTNDIPPVAMLAYQTAAAESCAPDDLWPILAGIGKVESDHGRVFGSHLLPNGDSSIPILGPELDGSGIGGNLTPVPVGVWQGRWGLDGDFEQALGPMQFRPGVFAEYAPSAAATPHNINDAAAAAAAKLCAEGLPDVEAALWRYNPLRSYVEEVLHWAALYAQGGGIASVSALALVDNPNVQLTAAAEADLLAGIVDPRLVDVVAHLSITYKMDILSFRTGHSRCKVLPNRVNSGPNCSVSNYWEGRAVDIMSVSYADQPLRAVSPKNRAAREIAEWLAFMPQSDLIRPNEVGSPWYNLESYHGHFANSLHQDHLHIGYHSPPPPEWANEVAPVSDVAAAASGG